MIRWKHHRWNRPHPTSSQNSAFAWKFFTFLFLTFCQTGVHGTVFRRKVREPLSCAVVRFIAYYLSEKNECRYVFLLVINGIVPWEGPAYRMVWRGSLESYVLRHHAAGYLQKTRSEPTDYTPPALNKTTLKSSGTKITGTGLDFLVQEGLLRTWLFFFFSFFTIFFFWLV